MPAASADASSGEHFAGGGGVAGGSVCPTPFVSAPSSPSRDAPFPAAAGYFFSAPASPARRGPGAGEEVGFDFDFDFSSRFPSPAAAAMSSADELFHNGQIRPMRLSSFLLRPQAPLPLAGHPTQPAEVAPADERGRAWSRSSVHHRRSRSLSPFRSHWLSPPPPSTAPEARASEPAAAPSASRSSSSSSTASSASTSSSRGSRRWGFLKELLHRSKSDGGKNQPPPSSAQPPEAPKRNPSPAAARGSERRRRRSAHERLYEARRAEAAEMRRRTFLPYRQGLLLGCLGLSSRGYGAMHGLAAAAANSRS